MKKRISFLLCILMLLSLVMPGTAMAVEANGERVVNFVNEVSMLDNQVVSGSDVTYSNLIVREMGGICRLEFTLHIGVDSCDIIAAGPLEDYELDNGSSVKHGCLYGNAVIGDTEYHVTIGLTKAVNSSDVNAGVVLMPSGEGWSNNMITFSVGNYTIPSELETLLADDSEIVEEGSSRIRLGGNAETEASLGNVLTVTANIVDSSLQNIAGRVYPHMYLVEEYVAENYSYTGSGAGASVSLYSMQLGVRTSSTVFQLDSIYTGNIPSNSGFKKIIWAVICDGLSYFNVSTSALTEILKSWTSNPLDADDGTNIKIALSQGELYNNIETCGLAAKFATRPNTALTPGRGTAVVYGNATFRVVQSTPLAGATIYYLTANEATKNVAVMVGIVG